jgi:hypothetical protein
MIINKLNAVRTSHQKKYKKPEDVVHDSVIF